MMKKPPAKSLKHRRPRPTHYIDDNFERRQGDYVERNGNLTLMQDTETGEPKWLAPHELDGSDG